MLYPITDHVLFFAVITFFIFEIKMNLLIDFVCKPFYHVMSCLCLIIQCDFTLPHGLIGRFVHLWQNCSVKLAVFIQNTRCSSL